MRNIFLSLVLVLVAQLGFSQTALNLTLAGQVTTPANLNDVWAWVDGTNNKEYAICGAMAGGEIIVDVSVPSAPVVVQTLPGLASTWRDMKTWGNYAYITNEAGDGLRIIDMSGLPNNIQYKDTVIMGMTTAHNIYIDAGFAYVVGPDIANGGCVFLDLSDPWYPSYAGEYNTQYIHDVYVRNDIAYAGELSNGLTIINVSNKSNPVILANRQYPNNFTHNTWLNDAGDVCFTTDEISAGKLTAFDISDLNNIEFLDDIQSSLSTDQLSIPHNTHVLNDFLVTSYYRDGLHIVDAARPHNLIEVGYYDTSTLTGNGFDGDWGAYPFLPSGVILASDMDNGLFVFNPTYVRGCYLEGQVTDANTTFAISGADIELQTTSITDVSNSSGDYATGTVNAGAYNVKYSKFGYRDSIIPVTLVNGQLTTVNVPLQPIERVNFTVNVIEEGSGNPIGNAEVLFSEINGAANLPYTTNSNGQVNDPNFIGATYTVIAGKWGYRTKQVSYTVNASNNSLTIELKKGYYDDFALDFNWTISGNANAGLWERGEPTGTFGQGQQFQTDDDIQSDISDECYVTGNGGGGIGSDDVDGGETILTSPPMDLSNYTEPVVRYYRWFANGGGFGGNPNDSLRIELDNGITTAVINRVFGTNNNIWVLDTFVVSNYIAPTANVRIRYIAGDYGQGHVTEAAVDGFEVIDLLPNSIAGGPVPADVDLLVSPNPITGTATVSYDLGVDFRVENAVFEVHDLMGKLLYQQPILTNEGSFKMNLDVASGLYIGSLRTNGRMLKSFRIMK